MNSLPLHFAYLALSQSAPPADFPPPAEVAPIEVSAGQAAASQPAAPGAPTNRWTTSPSRVDSVSAATNRANEAQPPTPSRVVPANATSLAPVSSADGVALAAMLIQDSMNTVDAANFDGNATSLLAAIQHVTDTTVQRQSVIAYWRLAAAISRHAFAKQEATFLQPLTSSQNEDSQVMLDAARAAAVARQHETAEAVTLSQYDLLEQSYATAIAGLPWPNDTPLVGSYRTNFESLFRDLSAPVRLRRIHRVLPATKRVIEARAGAVVTARNARDASHVAFREGRLPVRSVLESCARLREAHEAFLAAVLRYNESIAEYALAVVGPAADPATVVSTLIKWTEPPTTVVPIDRAVRQASAEEPLETHAEQPAPATTVAPRATPPPTPSLDDTSTTKSVLRSVRIAHREG